MKRVIDHIPTEVLDREAEWKKKRADFDPARYAMDLVAIFKEIALIPDSEWDNRTSLRAVLTRYPKDGKGFYSKSNLIAGYRHLVAEGDMEDDPLLMQRIRMKPTRTHSGVAPVTVLTAPAGCPGECIFCPDDYRMPKSYIYDEPGAQRAELDGFDPYAQTLGRIRAFENIGHTADKVELLVLGGTWSAYDHDYQEWFVRRCLDAMNAAGDDDYVDAATVEAAQASNSRAQHRNVGLVVETRPDWVTPDEIRRLRRYGVTKVQIGVQSLDDEILSLNKRGHDVATVRQALGFLRTAGFKLQLHWMPNLFGANPEKDRADFARFYSDPAIRPDELKIYPTSLIAGTELYERYQAGEYRPYTIDELVELMVEVKPTIPPYTRVNRLFRDIPAHHIEAGVTVSNLREVVHAELERRGLQCGCIRCHEVRRRKVSADRVELRDFAYETDLTNEHFLHFVTTEQDEEPGLIAGFLRLSLPKSEDAGSRAFLHEIAGNAMVREVHVYGPALSIVGQPGVGEEQERTQHRGLGSRLLDAARATSREAGFQRISVIAATGTKEYYAERGFDPGDLYMTGNL